MSTVVAIEKNTFVGKQIERTTTECRKKTQWPSWDTDIGDILLP